MLPDVFNTSPTAPVLPAPTVIIDTEKSSSACEVNTSFVPAVIVTSPFDDNVPVKFLLTVKLVSVVPPFAVVFNVLIVLLGNLNIEILLSGFCNFARLLVTIPAVVTSEPPTALSNSNSVLDTMCLTLFVIVPPASFVNVIESPIFKSTVNVVPLPNSVASELAIETLPNNATLSP